MSWRQLHLSLAECGSVFSLRVCDGMLEAELRAAVAARLGALAGCERAATDVSWYLTLDGGDDDAVVPLSPALPDGTRLLLHAPPACRPSLEASARHGSPHAAPPSPRAAVGVTFGDEPERGGAKAGASAPSLLRRFTETVTVAPRRAPADALEGDAASGGANYAPLAADELEPSCEPAAPPGAISSAAAAAAAAALQTSTLSLDR